MFRAQKVDLLLRSNILFIFDSAKVPLVSAFALFFNKILVKNGQTSDPSRQLSGFRCLLQTRRLRRLHVHAQSNLYTPLLSPTSLSCISLFSSFNPPSLFVNFFQSLLLSLSLSQIPWKAPWAIRLNLPASSENGEDQLLYFFFFTGPCISFKLVLLFHISSLQHHFNQYVLRVDP